MPNLAKLLANRASASVDFGPDAGVAQIEFYPARLTTAMLLTLAESDHLKELSQERALSVITSVTDTLLALLASWDLTETDPASGAEVPLPLDAEHLNALGVNLQWRLLQGILAAQAGEARATEAATGSVSAPASVATSQPTAR
jgi:hypothetical protein